MMRSFRIDRRAAGRVPAAAGVSLLALMLVTFGSPAGASTPPPPQVATGGTHPAPSRTGIFSAGGIELEGSIDPHGEAATYYFQYGPTVAYGQQTPTANLAAGTTTKVPVSQTVSNLMTGSHYRLVASTASGTTDGHDRIYEPKKPTSTTPGGSSPKGQSKTKPPTLAVTLSTKLPLEGQLVGSSVTIAGTLTGPGAVGHQIVLQSAPFPSSTAFTNVGVPQTVGSTGRFSFFVAHLSHSTRYRVAAVGVVPTYSSVITALADVHVTLHVRAVRGTGIVRLYGTVSPAVKGAIAFFELQQPPKLHAPAGPPKTPKNQKAEEKAEEKAEQAELPRYVTAFSVPVKRATRTFSRFSIVETIRKTGLYRVYVQLPRGPLASGHSGNLMLHTVAKKHGKSKS